MEERVILNKYQRCWVVRDCHDKVYPCANPPAKGDAGGPCAHHEALWRRLKI